MLEKPLDFIIIIKTNTIQISIPYSSLYSHGISSLQLEQSTTYLLRFHDAYPKLVIYRDLRLPQLRPLLSVEHSLRYSIVLPLTKLKKYVALAIGLTSAAIAVCYTGESAKRIQGVDMRYSISCLTVVVRLATCAAIYALSHATKRIRDQQARKLRQRVPQFGEDAEKANIMRKMKRTIKDMATLSIFNALILVPESGVEIAGFVQSPQPFVGINVLLTTVQAFLSPFIYTLCQKRLRRKLLCRQGRVDTSDQNVTPERE